MKQDFSKSAVYVGIALIAMSTLMFELLLVRIFSVTLWYHFAFMAISIAMLGMGAGGIYVYLFAPARSTTDTLRRLSVWALVFSATIFIALCVQLQTRFVPSFSLKSFLLLGQIYMVIGVPFFFGGLCISLILTQFSKQVSKLYFADLVGAGIGCFMVIPALSLLSGPSAIILSAILAGAAAYIFASAAEWRALKRVSAGLTAAFVVLLIVNSATNVLRIEFVKSGEEHNVVLERWNPFSRVVLAEWPEGEPFRGWGANLSYSGYQPRIKMISIDAHAATPVYEFNGDFNSVEALAFDSTAVAYYLKRGADRALVIGPGGGRDILTALLFGIRKVDGVEINPSVVEIVKKDLADYSGQLYHRDDVNVVVDEGRSYIARSKDSYDVIQASLVDSWAATAAGAFVLTENNLYTVEAFEQYYDHLSDEGILTMSRFFFDVGGGQTLRLVALGYEAWKAKGAANPANHIVVVRNRNMGTVLFKKSHFSNAELDALEDLCKEMGYRIVAGPRGTRSAVLEGLFESGGSKTFYENLPFDLEPPFDDKPFFFHMLRLRDFLRAKEKPAGYAFNDNAIFVLGSLMIIVSILCLLFIVGPLWTFRRDALRRVRGKWAILLYFSCLGVGFMMIEVPLMQKLLLFLGHPIYALAITLFGLLIFSGIGSYLTGFMNDDIRNRRLTVILALLAAMLILYILALPVVIHRLISIPTLAKIPLVVFGLIPLGLLMGMPFPMGIKLVDRRAGAIIPWVWGINGATSVFASVFAIVVALNWGFSAAMAVGVSCYALALIVVNLKALKEAP
jgi:hypothetical protein